MMAYLSAGMDHVPLISNNVALMAHSAHLTYLWGAITLEIASTKFLNA